MSKQPKFGLQNDIRDNLKDRIKSISILFIVRLINILLELVLLVLLLIWAIPMLLWKKTFRTYIKSLNPRHYERHHIKTKDETIPE